MAASFIKGLLLACRVERHMVGTDRNIGYRGVLNPQSELGHIVPGSLFCYGGLCRLCLVLIWFGLVRSGWASVAWAVLDAVVKW